MATDKSDVIQVKPEDLYEPSEGGFPGASQVQVDDVEEVKPSEVVKHDSHEEGEVGETPATKEESAPVTHETGKGKSTDDTEEVPKPTMKTKIREKVATLGDKFRPKDAVEAKNADPHPGLL